MTRSDCYVAGAPEDRPSHEHGAVVAGGVMTAEYKKLRSMAELPFECAGDGI